MGGGSSPLARVELLQNACKSLDGVVVVAEIDIAIEVDKNVGKIRGSEL
jgi:hypothetical protein